MRKLILIAIALSIGSTAHAIYGHKTYRAEHHKKHHKGLRKKKLEIEKRSFRALDVAIPDTLDLRPKLSQIEDQGQCGSCWAFSLTATHRDGHAINGSDPGRLSQEWLVDNSQEASGCGGGYFDSAADFVKPKGQPSWITCPYAQGSANCPGNLAPSAHITGWHMLGESGASPSVKDVEVYMASSGKPVSITVAAGAGDWESYSGGVYNGCKDAGTDHMINIVGWDNQGATFDASGNLPNGKGVWILRNSWGASWGESGYMRTQMTDESGVRCNNVAEEAAYFDFDDEPTPPTPPDPTPTPTPDPPPPAPACIGFLCKVWCSLPWCK